MHFLQLPIEDDSLAEQAHPRALHGLPLPSDAAGPSPAHCPDSGGQNGQAQPADSPTPAEQSGSAKEAEPEKERLARGYNNAAVIPEDQPIPFADQGNPIMAQVRCLA